MGNTDEGHEWEQTPWWHPRAWFGYHMRRWCWDSGGMGGEYDGQWDYQTYEQRAAQHLSQTFGGQTNTSGTWHRPDIIR